MDTKTSKRFTGGNGSKGSREEPGERKERLWLQCRSDQHEGERGERRGRFRLQHKVAEASTKLMGSLGDKVTCFRHLAPCRNRPVLAAPLRMVTGWEQSRQSLPGREAVVDAGGSHWGCQSCSPQQIWAGHFQGDHNDITKNYFSASHSSHLSTLG